MGGNELTEEGVQLTCGDTRFPTGKSRVECARNSVRMPRGQSGHVDSRSPLDLDKFAFDFVLQFVLSVFVNEVPLVRDNHQRTTSINDLLNDANILFCQWLGAIEEDKSNFRLLNCCLGANRGVVISTGRTVHLATNTGGVNKPPEAPIKLNEFVDRIAGRASKFVDDNAFGLRERVEKRRFANIRPSDKCDATRPTLRQCACHGGFIGQNIHDGVQQVAGTAAVECRNRVGLTHSEAPQVSGVGFLLRRINLICCQNHRLAF
ncbi:Uncharacterised protein [Chlamydia trachomatis]|nr:Uncharacterised protein [Chlamydia trachomatis]